eukprot:8134593-Pyramimonas_sp.AAC.1
MSEIVGCPFWVLLSGAPCLMVALKSAFCSFAYSAVSSSSNWRMLSSIGAFDFGSLWNRRFTSAPASPAVTSCSPSAMTGALWFAPRKRM